MYHKKIIPIPIYGGRLIIHLTDEPKRLSKATGEEEEEVFACCIRTNREDYNIFLNPEYLETPITLGIISHECLHAAIRLLDRRGVKLDPDNHEPLTYLLEWIVDNVSTFTYDKDYFISHKK